MIDHGQVIAQGTSDELKDRVGGERLEVGSRPGFSGQAAAAALAPMTDEPPQVEGVIGVGWPFTGAAG